MTERKNIPPRHALEDGNESPTRRPMMAYALWTVQALLALLFLFAGGAKLVLPPATLKGPVPLPVLFLRLIGVCEVLGALGLILPGILRIRPGLTPLAAAGLAIIMIGATVVNLVGGAVAIALVTLTLGLLAAFVAYGRFLWCHAARAEGSRNADRPSANHRP